MIPNSNKSIYLLLVAALAAVAWLGLQMLDAEARRARREATDEAPSDPVQESRAPFGPPRPAVQVRVAETRPAKALSADERVLRELDRVLVFESDFRPGEFDVRGVVHYISSKMDARVQLSNEARKALSRPIQLPGQRATARAVLDRLVLLAGLRWEVRHGRVRITDLAEIA